MMNKKVFFLKYSDYSDYKNDHVDGNIYVGRLDGSGHITSFQYGDINEVMGEYLHIGVNEQGKLEIRTDFYGFYSLFWMPHILNGDKGVLISNCFHSLSSYASNKAYDFTVLLPNILSKDQIFMQAYTTETSIATIKRLAWNQTIEIDSNGFELISRSHELEESLSYETLLQLGIKKTQEYLKQLDNKKSLNLYLSGGKDSRAILALALSTGLRPRCTTHSPVKFSGLARDMVDKDFIIANFLVNKFSLSWYQSQEKLSTKISFSESLERHLFYRSGYYLFSPNQYLVYSTDWGNEVQLRGAVGEIFKAEGSWGEYIKNGFIGRRLQGTAESFEDDCALFFKMISKPYGVDEKIYDRCTSHVINALNSLRESRDESIYNILEKHYLHYRNRFHFGHMRATEAEGKTVFYPLSNKYFYYANQKLSESEKKDGRLIYDIIENCLPVLNNYSYDDGYHKLLPSIRQDKMNLSDTIYDEFYSAESNNAKVMESLFSGVSYNATLEQKNFIERTMNDVRSHVNMNFSVEFQNYLKDFESNKRLLGKLVSILGSLPLSNTEFCSKNHQLIVIR